MKFLIIVITGLLVFTVNGLAIDKFYRIDFNEDISLEDVKQLENSCDIEIVQIVAHYADMVFIYDPGFSLDDNYIDDFLYQHGLFLLHAIKSEKQILRDINDEKVTDGAMQEFNKFQEAVIDLEKNGLRVMSVIIVNNNSVFDVNLFKSDCVISEVCARNLNIIENEVNGVEEDSYWHENWAPYTGGSMVNHSCAHNFFYFNKNMCYHSKYTYEHESQVYDKKFANYNGYSSSNLPRWYKDTPFFDTIDNFTVGSFMLTEIKDYVQYWTYMSLRKESSNSAKVIIKGQQGHRSPEWCYSTWCVYPDATSGALTSFTAPISSWCYWNY